MPWNVFILYPWYILIPASGMCYFFITLASSGLWHKTYPPSWIKGLRILPFTYPVYSQQDNLWQGLDPLVPPPHQDEMLVLSCHNPVLLSHGERNDMGQSFFPSKEYWIPELFIWRAMTLMATSPNELLFRTIFICRSMFVKFSSYSQIFLE